MISDCLPCLHREAMIETLTLLTLESLTLNRIHSCLLRIVPLDLSLRLLDTCKKNDGNQNNSKRKHNKDSYR